MERNLKDKNYQTNELLGLDPLELHTYLTENYCVRIPLTMETIEDLNKAASGIARASSYHTFFENMRQLANIQKSILKDATEVETDEEKKKTLKYETTVMLKREQIFESQAKVMDRTYQAISRLVTIKQMADKEITMTERI